MPALAHVAILAALLLASHALASDTASSSSSFPRIALKRRAPSAASLCGQQSALRARYGQTAGGQVGPARLTGGEDIPLVDFMDAQVRRGEKDEGTMHWSPQCPSPRSIRPAPCPSTSILPSSSHSTTARSRWARPPKRSTSSSTPGRPTCE
jgi:hypothetical protein